MSKQIQRRRGSNNDHAAFVGVQGEFTYNTDTKRIVAHDGLTAGGFSAMRVDELGATGGGALVGYDGSTVQAVLDTAKPISDYAALRAYAGRATQVRITSNGIAGFFYYDATDTTSTDNGGTIIVSSNGKRWKRLFDGAVNVKWFGAKGNGSDDDTLKVKAAIDHVKVLSGGGSVYFPSGDYSVTEIDLSNSVSDYTRVLRIFGDGPHVTKITLNTAGIGIDCIGRPQIQLDNFMVTSGASSPTVGILFARSSTASSIMFSTIKNVHVEGNFSLACVASIACESFAIFDTYVNNTNDAGGLGWFTGNGPSGRKQDAAGAYVNFTVSSSKGIIQTSANTSISFYRCNFLCYGDNGTPLSIDSSANASFYGCEFIPTTSGAKQCVLISDVYATPFNGPVNFNGCLFESQYSHGILAHSVRLNPSFEKISIQNCNFVLFGTGQESVTYSNGHTGNLVFLALTYQNNHRPTTETDTINLQYINRCFIEMPRGIFKIALAALNSKLFGTREFTQSAELITWVGNEYNLSQSSPAKPISGIFIKGERVWNNDPAAAEYIGWVASTENGAAWTATRANSTNYSVGTWIRDVATSGNPVYEVTATMGTGLTGGGGAPTKPGSIGGTVIDGELTLTLRSNRATTMLTFGAVV